MSKPTDIRIVDARCSTETYAYRTPMKFGGRVVNDVTVLNATVEVESRKGQRGTGRGSMTMGNVWGWPSSTLTTDQTLEAMVRLGRRVIEDSPKCATVGHPLEVTETLAEGYQAVSDSVTAELELSESMPPLAQLVAASPLTGAVFDAFGQMLGQSCYDLLGEEYCSTDLSAYLTDDFAGEYLDRYTLRAPKPTMPLYHLVGALDPLTDDDIPERLNDGMPETLSEWIIRDGLTNMKIKLNGDDVAWDVDRVLSIERIAAETQTARGCDAWCYSADFNERCENVEYVLEFLELVKEGSAEAFDRLQYIEQPTARDLRANPENRMHRAAAIKPVVIDESLVDLESLELSRELGYSGVALKACKGQGEAMLMGAAAQRYGMFLCVQDLTCVGASFLHSAGLSARIPTVAAIEGNGRQYCPVANEGWEDIYPTMFLTTDGQLGTAVLTDPGLGFRWKDD